MVVRLPTAQQVLYPSVCCTQQLSVACRVLYGEQGRFFEDEIRPHLKHKKKGMVAMAGELPVLLCREWMLRPISSSKFQCKQLMGRMRLKSAAHCVQAMLFSDTGATCFSADGLWGTCYSEACAAC